MPPDSLDQRVRISDDAIFRELDGEAVILHLDSGMYFGLDPVGTRLWQLIAQHGHLHPVFEAAIEEFAVDPAVLERDLLDLVAALSEKGLVTLP
jgi:hypothetical protein